MYEEKKNAGLSIERILAKGVTILGVALLFSLTQSVARHPIFHLIPGIYLFYPATAVSILSFYFFGPIAAIGIVIGSILTPSSYGMAIYLSIIKGCIHSLEGYLPYRVVTRRGGDITLYRQRTLYNFLLLGLMGGTFLDAVLGNFYQVVRYPGSISSLPVRFFSWWASDLLAAFCIALPLILLSRSLLASIPSGIRRMWFHRGHHSYLPRPLKLPTMKSVDFIVPGLFLILFFTSLFTLFPGVSLPAAWFFVLLIFPVVNLIFKGGVVAGVVGSSLATQGALFYLFTHPASSKDVSLIINALVPLILLNLVAVVGGFFNDGIRQRMMMGGRIQRFTESLIRAGRRREIISHLGAALLDVGRFKVIHITTDKKVIALPEEIPLDGDEPTIHYILPPTGITCYAWSHDTITRRKEKIADNLIQQARIALNNMELQRDLERNVQDLKIIFSVISHTLETLDVDELLARVTRTLNSTFNVSISTIFIYDSDARLLRLRAVTGEENSEIGIHELSPGEGIVGEAFESGEIVYVKDVKERENYVEGIEGIASESAIPLMVEEGAIGVLDLASFHTTPFTERDLALLKTLATHLAFAIHQADLHTALARAHELLQTTYFDTVETLCNAIEAKDDYTEGHVERTAAFATEMGLQLGLNEENVKTLRLGAMLHDIGKIGVPEEILKKPEPLNRDERAKVKEHSEIGVTILKNIAFIRDAIPIIYHHHEWFGGNDGKESFGYPKGLEGETIPLGARIVAVVDAFDAMTTSRPYRHALSWDEAVKRLIVEKGRQFDPHLVDLFVNLLIQSYNYHPGEEIQRLMAMPPLKGRLPNDLDYEEGLVPKFT